MQPWVSESQHMLPQCTPGVTRRNRPQMWNELYASSKQCKMLCERKYTKSSTSTVSLDIEKFMDTVIAENMTQLTNLEHYR